MKKGDKVHWNWGSGEAEGKIEQKHTEPVTKPSKAQKLSATPVKTNPLLK